MVKWQTRQLEGLVGNIPRGGSSPLPSTIPLHVPDLVVLLSHYQRIVGHLFLVCLSVVC